MSKPALVPRGGPLQGRVFEITIQGLRIGRDAGNDICLDDSEVSRHHARVILHNGAIWVQDAGSRNGIYINDVRIAGHKQLSPGDRLRIGGHEFAIELQEGDGAVSVDLDALGLSPRGGRRRLGLLLGVALVAAVLVLLLAWLGRGGDESGQAQPADAAPHQAYSLEQVLGPAEQAHSSPQEPPPPTEEPVTELGQVLGNAQRDEMADWPDPPAGATWQELVDMGHSHYQAGRLHDALVHYQMAMKLNPDCSICRIRIDRLDKDIARLIDENFESGLQYYQSLQYQQAMNAWQTVLLLDPDGRSPRHQETVDYIDEARKHVQRQY